MHALDATVPVCLLGGGGHALVVAEVAMRAGWRVAGCFDDDPAAVAGAVMPLLGPLGTGVERASPVIVAIGDLGLRERLIGRLAHRGAVAVPAVDPSAVMSSTASFGAGVLVGARAAVNARAVVGDHTIINTGAIVEHECEIGWNAHIAPGAVLGGRVRVGPGTLVGLGARVLPGVTIGAGCLVPAGAVVTRDAEDGERIRRAPRGTDLRQREPKMANIARASHSPPSGRGRGRVVGEPP